MNERHIIPHPNPCLFSSVPMRLINTRTLALKEFFGTNIPRYAILSHTWGPEEVTFQDWKNLAYAREKRGFQKIELARTQAIRHDLKYLWVDTTCINKESSAELSEAINSMFSWYRNAEVCYAYLSDVSEENDPDESTSRRALFTRVSKSHWFTRGWTLQELLAPQQVLFFSREWRQVGTRKSLADVISKTTNIGTTYLYHKKMKHRTRISAASVAERMSWLSRRKTTRVEDMAYCMLGIFDINMPLLYGEGTRAFTRLQEEILKISTDESLFCWSWNEDDPVSWSSMLAPSPRNFRNAAGYQPARDETSRLAPYSMTNFGLSIQLPIVSLAQMPRSIVDQWLRPFEYICILSASTADGFLVALPLEKTLTADTYKVVRDSPRPIIMHWKNLGSLNADGVSVKTQNIFVPSREPGWDLQASPVRSFDERFTLGEFAVLLLVFNSSKSTLAVTNIEAIPKHNKSKAGFIKMKRFTIAGPPNANTLSSWHRFHVNEVHGTMIRVSCDTFRPNDGPLCCIFGVFVGEDKSTKWFCRILDTNAEGKTSLNPNIPYTHRSLETFLVNEAAKWQSFCTNGFKSADGNEDVSKDERVINAFGPEFLVETNHQKTTTKAAHLILRKQSD
ncbi:Vegetative incompatibility protein HET-E-1-like protein 2 [Colletotrichum truncatum]|uniref:Vegetative incompatibility protein HET-E-1-like protein 2 n=1 Tax=Colletotrichum truncatum TaxID=5467 RepID=A0ACC3ZBK1_COLTU|nr:Vegetative incompatibility protein HET-E-1-like protein 2 [Colletotrichum truncatum]KAF6787838.1 Vegetative incompatibility protein HET-E-1-like protein 2 [Colletotrichum truncatum]